MVTVTKKYQVTIPKKVREDSDIEAGDDIIFLKLKDGYTIVKAEDIIREGVELCKDIDMTISETKKGLGKDLI
ncbi:MAG: AbrB/MazE/SpoVT family DNA-binding domain-containing protein [Methanocellales archaeon]|nr:AbrB/MazE/SpoVT family DNA-binding domain-containing protein [Methanocellales archaeon]